MKGESTISVPRILYVLDRFPVLSETFVSAEIRALRESGVDVEVLTTRHPRVVWSASADLASPGERWGTVAAAMAHLWWMLTSPRRYWLYLRTLVAAPASDVPFMLWAPGAALVARRSRRTRLHTHFAFRAASFARSMAALLAVDWTVTTHANDIFADRAYAKRRLSGAGVLTISQYNKRYLKEMGVEAEVNYCGIDLSSLSFVDDLADRSIDVLFVGRLVPKKNPLGLIRALSLAEAMSGRALRVTVLGDGPLLEECVQAAGDLGLAVSFLGAQSHDRVLETIMDARSLCLPCQEAADGDLDGIPVVLMEAMALGTPVVTTPVSGIPELVTPDSGWLVPEGRAADQVPALAESILACLLADDATLDGIRRSARARLESRFSLRDQAAGVLAARPPAKQR